MSSESISSSVCVEMAATVKEEEEVVHTANEQQSASASKASTSMKKMENRKMVRLNDRCVRRLQSLPPIKPPAVPESFFEAFPNMREVLRHADAQVKAMIRVEEDISRPFHMKGFAELDAALLSPPDDY